MASPVAATADSVTQPALGLAGAWQGLRLREVGDVRRDEVPFELDRKLTALCRERGPLRAVLARIAFRMVWLRGWERLGYARLSDYAAERLGLSARSVQDLAEVGVKLFRGPRLEDALVSGALGWTKVRLLARLPREEDEAAWIAHARSVTAEELSREVRKVDRGSVEAGAVDDESSRLFEVACSAEVRGKWQAAREAARRMAGRMLPPSEAAELIAAEVLSAVPIDEHGDEGSCEEKGTSWGQEREPEADAVEAAVRPPWRSKRTESAPSMSTSSFPRPVLPASLRPLVERLEEADAFDLDERFRRALSMEQRLEARIGPLLTLVWERWVYRALGYRTREAYARERLGMDPTRARALVRLEGALVLNETFARAYRTGALSWVKAGLLAPLVSADSLGWFVEDWVAWAQRVTVRRLREDVEQALALAEMDPEAFRRTGGPPAEASGNREIGAPPKGTKESVARADRWTSTEIAPLESCSVRFIGSADVVQLFRALLCTVRRRMERDEARLPTAGEALGAMLDHVLSSWGALETKVAAHHRVFARDGWRCAAPGCTSMQNLHSHHIRFRSAGGSDEPENRITLCAFHHLRGVHAGLLRCVGRAPDGLEWEMGIRPGVAPLLSYRSGDLRATQTGPLRDSMETSSLDVAPPPGHRAETTTAAGNARQVSRLGSDPRSWLSLLLAVTRTRVVTSEEGDRDFLPRHDRR